MKGFNQADYPKLGLLFPKMPLLSQRIPANQGELGKVIGFGNSWRITNLRVGRQNYQSSPLFYKRLPIPKGNRPQLFFWLFYVFEQMSKSFKLLSLQDFYCRRFKTWSKLEEWGMLRANEPCDLINPALPPNLQKFRDILLCSLCTPHHHLKALTNANVSIPMNQSEKHIGLPQFRDILLCIL